MASKRTRRKERHRASLWDERRERAARDPVEAPVLAYDLARSKIAKLPRDRRAAAWRKLAQVIDDYVATELDKTPADTLAGGLSPSEGGAP